MRNNRVFCEKLESKTRGKIICYLRLVINEYSSKNVIMMPKQKIVVKRNHLNKRQKLTSNTQKTIKT